VTTVILDRLVHCGLVITIRRVSYRLPKMYWAGLLAATRQLDPTRPV
jgi:hypothetical protein